MTDFIQYLNNVSNCKCKTLDLGKKFVSELFTIRPDLYCKITGTKLDTFYDDDNIPEFLIFLLKNWDDIDYSYFKETETYV